MIRILERLKSLFHKRSLDADLEAEMATHLHLAVEENIRLGMPAEEARRKALVRFGGIESAKELHRDTRALPQFETLAQDLRYASRALIKNRGFTAVAILTLALGIGANTAIFTVINAVLLRSLPYANAKQLVTWRQNESLMDVDDIRALSGRLFSAGGAVNEETMDYTGTAEPVEVHAGYADAGFFKVLGVNPLFGRTLMPEEDRKGGPRAVVLTYSFWRKYLSSDPNVLGKTIRLSGNGYTVVGVMPRAFAAPQFDADVFVSLRVVYPEAAAYRGVHFMRSYWRLRSGVTLSQAAAGMKVIDARLAAAYPEEEKNRRTVPVALQDWVAGPVRPALGVLFGAVCLVLLIACANFASLLMARSVSRRREMVVRAALGGSRNRLIRQSLTESSLLAALGAAAGLTLAVLGTRLLIAAKPAALARYDHLPIDGTVLIFTLVVALLTGFIFGLMPARNAARPEVSDALKQETRTASAGSVARDFRGLLVMGEIAMALVLLVGAGLLIKTFLRLRSVDPGFNPDNVISLFIQLKSTQFTEVPKETLFRRELLARLNTVSGVQAAMISDLPLTGGEVSHSVAIESRANDAPGDEPEVDTFCVMGDYFQVMQIPLRSGRPIRDSDRENQPLVAVVNEALAREYFPGRNPIGQRIRWARDAGAPRWMTIVGVAANVKQYSLAEPPFPAVFIPFAQSSEPWRRWMSVVVRMPHISSDLIQSMKARIWSLDNSIPLNHMEEMDQLLRLSISERRFNMFLLAMFAAVATALAGVGIYGVMSYGIGQRRHEFGIRIAVGALPTDVLRLVLREGMRLAAIGVIAGIVTGSALTRFMRTLLFNVAPNDPIILTGVVLLMLGVTLAACLIPAHRAIKVDPIVALRYQ